MDIAYGMRIEFGRLIMRQSDVRGAIGRNFGRRTGAYHWPRKNILNAASFLAEKVKELLVEKEKLASSFWTWVI